MSLNAGAGTATAAPYRDPDAETLRRLRDEQAFHDAQAYHRALRFAEDPSGLRFSDDFFLDHETWVRPAMAMLGDLRGRRALDFGCGHGMAAVVMARRGARVTAFDLSRGYTAECASRAAANGVRVAVVQADGERTPFADGSFDRIWGNAVLHHLDPETAAAEVRRLLAPGGVAVFCEPWAGNPVFEWARERLDYQDKHRTHDEKPLDAPALRPLRRTFPRMGVHGFQFLSAVSRLIGPGPALTALDTVDRVVLSAAPFLQRLCRYVVIRLPAE